MTTNQNDPQVAVTRNPGDLVEMYRSEGLPQGADPAEHTAVTTREAFNLVWKDKGYSLLEDYTPTAEPPATVQTNPGINPNEPVVDSNQDEE